MQNNLKELLEQRGVSVSHFGRQIGIPQPTLSRIVNGKVDLASISVRSFMRIAHGLGLSVEELYFGDLGYDARKAAIDRVYATTCAEGRRAMVANAAGVARAYPPQDDGALPAIRDDVSALKGL